MENTLTVNDQELMIKEYEGQRVVTMWDIANLHGVDVRNIRMNFKNNQKYLIEGEDYFLVEKTDDFVVNLIDNEDLSKNTVNRAKDIPVFTETGYLMMTKPMTDEISWKVQRLLVNCYFKVKETVKEVKENNNVPLANLADVNKTLEILTGMYQKMHVPSEEILKTTECLLAKTGLELPKVNMKRDKSNFISLVEVVEKIGIYDSYKKPNLEAAVSTFEDLGIDSRFYKVNVWFSEEIEPKYDVKFSPEIISLVSNYLKEKNYPKYLEKQLRDGNIKRMLVLYKGKDL